MNKNQIISEIKRTAAENGGVTLGRDRFAKNTGIKDSIWWGKYWRTWNDALKEAGFSENKLNTAHNKELLVEYLAKLTKALGRFPASVDLRMARKNDPQFPSHNSFDNLGSKSSKVMLVKEFASQNTEYKNIVNFLPDLEDIEPTIIPDMKTKEGVVYMGMLRIDTKKRYKIGKTNYVERRTAELSLQLPEKLELVHCIKTDDINGIELYWHKRFADRNTNGEWFDLSAEDVRAFKSRKSM
jgi:hypothetical protein